MSERRDAETCTGLTKEIFHFRKKRAKGERAKKGDKEIVVGQLGKKSEILRINEYSSGTHLCSRYVSNAK